MSRYCSLPECDSLEHAKGLCKRHYMAEWGQRLTAARRATRQTQGVKFTRWPLAVEAELRELLLPVKFNHSRWAIPEGLTATKIGKRLSSHHGRRFTKNAVLSKIRRL